MAKGGVPWSGRALRFVLWRAPLRAGEYTAAGFLATTQEVGRRWISLGGLGIWLWALWKFTGWTGVQGFQEVAGFLLLLWLWRVVVLLRWTIHLRVEAARVRSFQRQQFQMIQQLPGQIRQLAASVPRPDGGVDVLTMSRTHPDHQPIIDEQRRVARDQLRQVREQLPEESRDLPMDLEPVLPMPRWLRKRRPR